MKEDFKNTTESFHHVISETKCWALQSPAEPLPLGSFWAQSFLILWEGGGERELFGKHFEICCVVLGKMQVLVQYYLPWQVSNTEIIVQSNLKAGSLDITNKTQLWVLANRLVYPVFKTSKLFVCQSCHCSIKEQQKNYETTFLASQATRPTSVQGI